MEMPSKIISDLIRNFGTGLGFAAVFAVAIVKLYGDIQTQNQSLIGIIERNIQSNHDLADAVEKLSSNLK